MMLTYQYNSKKKGDYVPSHIRQILECFTNILLLTNWFFCQLDISLNNPIKLEAIPLNYFDGNALNSLANQCNDFHVQSLPS